MVVMAAAPQPLEPEHWPSCRTQTRYRSHHELLIDTPMLQTGSGSCLLTKIAYNGSAAAVSSPGKIRMSKEESASQPGVCLFEATTHAEKYQKAETLTLGHGSLQEQPFSMCEISCDGAIQPIVENRNAKLNLTNRSLLAAAGAAQESANIEISEQNIKLDEAAMYHSICNQGARPTATSLDPHLALRSISTDLPPTHVNDKLVLGQQPFSSPPSLPLSLTHSLTHP